MKLGTTKIYIKVTLNNMLLNYWYWHWPAPFDIVWTYTGRVMISGPFHYRIGQVGAKTDGRWIASSVAKIPANFLIDYKSLKYWSRTFETYLPIRHAIPKQERGLSRMCIRASSLMTWIFIGWFVYKIKRQSPHRDILFEIKLWVYEWSLPKYMELSMANVKIS